MFSRIRDSCFHQQFVWSEFSEEYSPTEKRETFYPSVVLADRLYELKITDLPTIPYFPVSSHLEWTDFRYYGLRSATAYVLVFDLSNQDTFQVRHNRDSILKRREIVGGPLARRDFNFGGTSEARLALIIFAKFFSRAFFFLARAVTSFDLKSRQSCRHKSLIIWMFVWVTKDGLLGTKCNASWLMLNRFR